ncbi:hypothetical protein B0H34DRAFT_217136 [Crassisporium funariophilum]|nr:hypothetical protein B0H34DRAFT_217136 [Crassisporium funariophilum]
MAARLLVVAAVANVALAYSNTFPVVAWSSFSSHALESLPSRLANTGHSASILDSIFATDDVCNHDAIVILHASDLRTLPSSCHVARSLSSSPSARQYPYVSIQPEFDASSVAQGLSSRCRSPLLKYTPGQSGITLEQDVKHIVHLNMPYLEESGRARKDALAAHESLLENELSVLASTFPDHLVVYTGAFLPSHSKRQAPDIPDRPVLDLDNIHLAANTTLPTGGILKRYQLLTPGLIMVLLIVLFILVPVTMMGMNALASIQNPLRVDTSKAFNAQDRKNQ